MTDEVEALIEASTRVLSGLARQEKIERAREALREQILVLIGDGEIREHALDALQDVYSALMRALADYTRGKVK